MNKLILLLPILLCSCAHLSTHQTVTVTSTNGTQTVTSTRNSATAFFDSKSDLTKFKSLNTEKTQSVAIGALNQEANSTGAVQVLRIIVEGGKAAAIP